jgi:hypothetical protein
MNSRQALLAVVQTSFAYDGTAFIQTDLSEAVLDFVSIWGQSKYLGSE